MCVLVVDFSHLLLLRFVRVDDNHMQIVNPMVR